MQGAHSRHRGPSVGARIAVAVGPDGPDVRPLQGSGGWLGGGVSGGGASISDWNYRICMDWTTGLGQAELVHVAEPAGAPGGTDPGLSVLM